MGLSYGYISPPQPGTDEEEISSEEITSFTENILQINVYFDTLSEHVIETKATYRVCEVYIPTFFPSPFPSRVHLS